MSRGQLERFGLIVGLMLCVSALSAQGADETKQAEAEAVWLVDVVLWDAVRNSIDVRRSRAPDSRMQPSLERLERYLGSSKKDLMAEARTPSVDDRAGGVGTRATARIEAVKRLAVLAGMTDDRELREFVIDLLGDRDRDVQNAAALGVLQFEDQAGSAIDGLLALLANYGTFQQSLLTLTRVDPRGAKSFRALLRLIEDNSRMGPAPWINALANFRWDEKTPAAQRREVLRFLDALAGNPRASGGSTARKVASDIRRRIGGPGRS